MADIKQSPKAPVVAPVVAPKAPVAAPKLPNKPAAITAASTIPLPAENNHHMMYMTTCLDRVAFF